MPVAKEKEVSMKDVLGRLCHRDLYELYLMGFTEDDKNTNHIGFMYYMKGSF
jgi:hypothetical protein